MKKFKTLVAVDFSNDSFTILQKAVDLTKKLQGVVDVVHVVENSFFSLKKDIDTIKKNSLKKLHERFPDITEDNFHCISGKVKDTIGTTAEILNSDLVVIGKSGERYFLGDFYMGSHTKDIVRSCGSPVLVVKSEHELNYENILMLTDLSNESAQAIQKVAILFPHAHIKLLNFYFFPFGNRLESYGFNQKEVIEYQYSLNEDSRLKLDKFLDSLNLPSTINISGKTHQSSLNPKLFEEEVADLNFDLVAIHTTGRVSFYALDILENSRKDVVVLRV